MPYTIKELRELARKFEEKVDKEYYKIHTIDDWGPEYDIEEFINFLEQRELSGKVEKT